MDASSVLWSNWHEQIKELLAGMHGHQKKTLAFFVLGMVLSGCAVLQRVAETLSERGHSLVKMSSIERRLARFLANERIVVPVIWKQFVAQVLPYFRGQKLHFVLDNTPFQDELTIVYIGLLVHSRVLPLAWAVMPAKTTWEEEQWHIVARLLDQITLHLPETSCTLIADRGLTGMPLVKLCRERGWHYLLRVCQEHTVRRWMGGKLEKSWKSFGQIILKPGYRWFGQARVWQEETLDTWVSITWEKDYQEAWILISDEQAGPQRIKQYAWRMRVEATFQDSKSRGWNMEASWITDRTHLDRLFLVLFLALWWTSHLAAACIHHGQRHRFDRVDRRDKSIFRLGRLWLLDILRRAHNRASLRWCLPFQKTNRGWRFALRFSLWRRSGTDKGGHYLL
ncbi:MAG: transposase [Ktedonobacteraceae bacterium]